MTELIVNDEQAQVITSASAPVVVVDSHGRTLGRLTPACETTDAGIALSAEELAEIKRRMKLPGPGFTTQEVLEYLQTLDDA